jgi:hypothetical protein
VAGIAPATGGGWRASEGPTTRRVALLALCACAALYAHGLRGAFVIDDRTYIIENDFIPALGLRGAAAVFTRPANFWGEFLPVRDVVFLAEYAAFGRNPLGYHAVSLLLYAVVCILAFALVRELASWRAGAVAPGAARREGIVAGAVALLFLTHPVHVESVAYVSGQKDLLSGIFALGSLLAFARAFGEEERRTRRWVAGVACYALALLSKPTAIALGALVPVLWLVADSARRPGAVRAAGTWAAVHVPVALWFAAVMREAYARWATMSAVSDLPLGDRLPVALKILGAHARLALWPHPLSFGYPFDGSPAPDANLVAGVLALAAVGAVVAAWRREPLVVFGGALFLLSLAPVLQLVGSTNNASIYDRYLFLPVLGLAVVAERLVRSLPGGPPGTRVHAAVLAGVGIAGAAGTVAYVPAFADDVAVVRNTYERFPEWSSAGFELGYSLVEAGRVEEARALLAREPSLGSPPWVRPYLEGWILLQEGRAEEAVSPLGWAQQLALSGGYFPFPSVPLGAALVRLGRLEEAEGQLRAALASPIYMPLEVYHARTLLAEVARRRAGGASR